jgi:fatty acid/phospholipid biosynthesis enzyme
MSNFGRIPGVERPAAIVPLLGLRKDVYLIDAGANTEVHPKQLLQFACMGSTYAHYAGGITHPRIGLLSNGSEPNKGNKVGRDAYQLLAAAKNILFTGNVEGHTMLASDVNVIDAQSTIMPELEQQPCWVCSFRCSSDTVAAKPWRFATAWQLPSV